MSTTPAAKSEQKYYEKLNIAVLSIDKIKELVKRNIFNTFSCWKNGKDIEKQTFHIIGPAGIGKTQICLQLSEELTDELRKEKFLPENKKFETILIKSPVLSRDDILIPFPVVDNGNTKFKMLYSDFIPLDPDSFGLFVIDEFARGDHNLQQLLWQIQNEYKIHLKDLPRGWFVISLDNPDDQEYSMDVLQDAAGLRRTLHIYTDVSAPAFLNYAIAKKFHPSIIDFIQIHNEFVYDFAAQKRGSVYANPASWERVSNILWGYEYNGGILQNIMEIDSLISGLLNTNKTMMFMDYLKERKDISPKDIFNVYEKVRKDIRGYIKESDNAKLGKIMASFITFLITSKPTFGKKEVENVARFLTDLPSDISATFITKIDGYDRKSKEFEYATRLHVALIQQNEEYRDKYYSTMVGIGKKAAQ